MADSNSIQRAVALLDQRRRGQMGERRQVPPVAQNPHVQRLRRWQAERLEQTHADLLASSRYGVTWYIFR